jgi:hypothetical protein
MTSLVNAKSRQKRRVIRNKRPGFWNEPRSTGPDIADAMVAKSACPLRGLDDYRRYAGDVTYLYDICCDNGKIRVTAHTTRENDGAWTVEKEASSSWPGASLSHRALSTEVEGARGVGALPLRWRP